MSIPKEAPLPSRQHTDESGSLRGWRHLELWGSWSTNGQLTDVWYQSLNQADRWRSDTVAVCRAEPFEHQPPEDECSCGWYSLKDPERIRGGDYSGYEQRRRNGALAEVALWGNVIETEAGWRAERQRILSLEIDENCVRCGKEADGVGILPNRQQHWLYTVNDQAVCGPLYPYCRDCAARVASWDELQRHCGVDVTVGAPYDDNPTPGDDDTPPPRAADTLLMLVLVAAVAAAAYLVGTASSEGLAALLGL